MKSTKIASFEKCTKKNLVNGQMTIWASETPGNSDEPSELWIVSEFGPDKRETNEQWICTARLVSRSE